MTNKLKKGVDHIGVCVVFFCHDGNGNFIMSKRGTKAQDEHGRWDIGGGSVERGDSFEQTLRKEIKEEYCTDVLEYEFLGHREVHRTNTNGEPTHWIAFDYKVRVDPTKVANGEPHKLDEVSWFTFETLPDPIHSAVPDVFERYREKLEKF